MPPGENTPLKILVTGATGFIGAHFVHHAMNAGYEVLALRLPGTQPRIPWPKAPHWIETPMDKIEEEQLRGCHAMVHFAAVGVSPHTVPWTEYLRWNVEAPLHLAHRAVRAGARRIITCGSCFEFGRSAEKYDAIPADAPMEPATSYGASKAMATLGFEALARETNTELAVMRLFHVFGETQQPTSFWSSLKAAAEKGHDFPMTPGEQIRDFISVEEIGGWFLKALASPTLLPGEPRRINVGTGKPVRLVDFAQTWWQRLGASGKLLVGALPYRDNEVMRYVPEILDWK